MFDSNIRAVLIGSFPTIVIISVISISMRIVYLMKNKEKPVFYQELLKYVFIVYIMCLFYVVTFQDVAWSGNNFIPFKEIFRYSIGSRAFFKNVIGNMIMFIPYGFFVSYFLKLEKVSTAFLMTLITSITIEVTQLVIGRVFDVDDILLNIIGGLIGFGIFSIIYKIKSKLPAILKKPFVYNIIMIILMAVALIYLVNLVR